MFFGGMEVKYWLKMGLILWSYIFKSFLQFRGSWLRWGISAWGGVYFWICVLNYGSFSHGARARGT